MYNLSAKRTGVGLSKPLRDAIKVETMVTRKSDNVGLKVVGVTN